MARALELAARGRYTSFPNPRVGCVLVSGEGQVVGEGWHERAGEPHAEVHALERAGDAARGATAYVSLEPCAHFGRTPPCADALIRAQVVAVHAAMQDPDPRTAGGGLARLRNAGIVVSNGLLEAPARELNRGFVARLERGRPWTTLKLAMSLDGRTAMASGESQWITSEAARADVHRLRAEAGAVLTSSATALADDPALSVRLPGFARQPDRIVLDARARVPASAQVWASGARRLWVTQSAVALPPGVEACVVAQQDDWLPAVWRALAAAQINSVLVECGAHLAGALLQAALVDELVVYCAPALLGHAARPLVQLPGLERLQQRLSLSFVDLRQVGPDLRITLRPAAAGA
jgi:diaminohydroxyphosphoribosylaminopyrimidine deaminase/5-amino-6-(5-phosphoribosylamino)uracil reductase